MDDATTNELNVVPLQGAVLCVDCEIITESRGGRCRVCGGSALLSLARVLGGPLGAQRTILLNPAEAEMEQVIESLIESAYQSEQDPDEETAA